MEANDYTEWVSKLKNTITSAKEQSKSKDYDKVINNARLLITLQNERIAKDSQELTLYEGRAKHHYKKMTQQEIRERIRKLKQSLEDRPYVSNLMISDPQVFAKAYDLER